MKRTSQQNKALHLWIRRLSEAMIDAGLDMRKEIRVEIPATPSVIKETMLRPVVEALYGVESTTQLESDQVDEVYRVLHRAIAERWGIDVPFPSIEELRIESIKESTEKFRQGA